MFTGIIRHSGTVAHLRPTPSGARLSISDAHGFEFVGLTAAPGDSISVNGVCLTVVEVSKSIIEFDVIAETLKRSTIGSLGKGKRVNLETSLRVGETVDGHFVQGHVDGLATLARRNDTPHQHVLWFEPQDEILPYIIPKGSIAVDGVSLTIADLAGPTFGVALIPTTLGLTNLGELRIGHRVNIETDIISRTVVHTLRNIQRAGGLTIEHLKTQGFA